MARKKKPEEHVNHERWLVSYADFITLLFAFFTTLYAISTVDQKKASKFSASVHEAMNADLIGSPRQGASPFENPAMAPIAAAIDVAVREQRGPGPGARSAQERQGFEEVSGAVAQLARRDDLKDRVAVSVSERGLVITLKESGFFQSGDAELRGDALAALADVADAVGSKPGLSYTVEGHTDDVPVSGRHASNWELSTARAAFVMRHLVGVHGFDAHRMAVAGYGEFRPLADNATPEGRAKNRRVDIVVRPAGEDLGPRVGPLKIGGEGSNSRETGREPLPQRVP